MSRPIPFLLLALSAFAGPFAVSADEVESAEVAAIRQKVEQRFPDAQIEHVGRAAWGDWYEIATANEIVYTNADVTLMFRGAVFDLADDENLTQQRWGELNAVDFATLPTEMAIKTVKGDGSRKLAVFADPDCPFCQQLEQTLAVMTDVTIYTYLFPLEEIHPGARAKAEQIWCAQDRSGAWLKWMLGRTLPAAAACENQPIDTLLALGAKLKINSTPTVFFTDGSRIPGAPTLEQLEAALKP